MNNLCIADRVVIYLAIIWVLILVTAWVCKTPNETPGLENRIKKLEQRCDEAFNPA